MLTLYSIFKKNKPLTHTAYNNIHVFMFLLTKAHVYMRSNEKTLIHILICELVLTSMTH